MRKYAYLARLEELLAALPVQERQDALNYYEEYFDAAGNENEEQTARELGDPAEVARKILEGEGIAPETGEAEPESGAAPAPSQPEPVTPPAGPEPPPLENPETYPTQKSAPAAPTPKRKIRRLWLGFWLLVALALLIQISVLLLGLGQGGGSTASMAVETALSEPVSSLSEPVPQPTGSLEAAGPVTYSGMLDAPGEGTLYVTLTRGNVAFKAGEQAAVEVRNVDVSSTVRYEQTVDRGYAFVCESTDPNTHVTITLPADAFNRLEVHISNSGAIELGNLQIRQIDAFTASGPIQSGDLRAETLNLVTALGNIWLEQVSDDTEYPVQDVCLQAPHGSVAAHFSAPRNEWEAEIEAPDGVAETAAYSSEETQATRSLQILSGSTVNLQYGA